MATPGSNLRVEVHTDVSDPARSSDAVAIWAELEEACPASVYQTRRFALPWLETVGAATGCRPAIAILRDAGDAAAGLLPMMVRESGGLRRLEFIGGEDSNTNMGLFRDSAGLREAASARDLLRLLQEIAAHPGVGADIAVLTNQPQVWRGTPNPLAQIESQPAASQCHSAILGNDAETFMRNHFSKDGRKKLRAKLRKLEENGPVRMLRGDTATDAQAILDVFTIQKRARFAELNIANRFDTPDMQQFMRSNSMTLDATRPAIRLYALLAGDNIAAVFGGGVHQGRFSGMFNSFNANPAIAKASPGDQLLKLMVEEMIAEGLSEFDLGVGEARYKQAWCDRAEPLFDVCIGMTARGQFFALAERGKLQLKRAIKQSEWAWPLAQKLRRNFRLSA